jgi:SAM-dependent MidA family methyltransferase
MKLQQADLPEPSADARAASAALLRLIAAEIDAGGGWISFARYMELALYAPGLGYYSGGSHKFGDHEAGGDFLTAPELTPLFAAALARQVAQILAASAPQVIEAGAGSGRLAADLLPALAALDCLPERYRILELSGELRARQQATLAARAPQFADRTARALFRLSDRQRTARRDADPRPALER